MVAVRLDWRRPLRPYLGVEMCILVSPYHRQAHGQTFQHVDSQRGLHSTNTTLVRANLCIRSQLGGLYSVIRLIVSLFKFSYFKIVLLI